MTLAATELCLRAAAVTLLLVLAVSMFADFRNVLAGRLVIAFALGTAAHAVTASIGAGEPISIWHAPLIAISTGDIVVFWLFTRALFDDAFVLRWWHGLIWPRWSRSASSIACGSRRAATRKRRSPRSIC